MHDNNIHVTTMMHVRVYDDDDVGVSYFYVALTCLMHELSTRTMSVLGIDG